MEHKDPNETKLTEMMAAARHMVDERLPHMAIEIARVAHQVAEREYGVGSPHAAAAAFYTAEILEATGHKKRAADLAESAAKTFAYHFGQRSYLVTDARKLADKIRSELANA